MRLLVLLLSLLLALPAFAQQEVRSSKKGSSTPLPVTGTVIDANHNGLDVAIVAGAGGDGIIKDGTGDTTQANVISGRLSVDTTGTVTANAGTNLNTSALLTTSAHDAAFGTAGTADTQVLSVQGIAGMTKVLVTPDSVALPANQSVNAAQFGGTNISTGTGAGGAGIPRVTVSSDSSLAANQSVNISQLGAATIQNASNGLNTTGTGLGTQALTGQCDDTSPTALTENSFGHARINCATHEQLVQVSDGTTKVAVIAGTTALKTDLSSIAGTATPTGNGTAATSLRMSLASDSSGNIATIGTSVTPGTAAANMGKAEDAAHNSADVGVMALGVRTDPTTTAYTTATTEYSPVGVDYVGAAFVGAHPGRFSCFIQNVTVTTQCQAAPAAGLRAYVSSVWFTNQSATALTLDVVFGTGANCATGITALTHKAQFGTNNLTTTPQDMAHMFDNNPLVPTAANAICVRPSAATAFGATITGFIAP